MPASKTRRSLGCDTCLTRKIRCDRSAGSCKNCKVAGWVCDGYPDKFDVMLRDQTSEVTQKAQASFQIIPQKSPHAPQRCKKSPNGERLSSLSMNQTELAVAFFLAHHVMNASAVAHYYALGTQCGAVRQALFYATAAVGLAELALIGNSPDARASSIAYYAMAVKLISSSLDDPVVAGDDLLLISINTLTTVETITGRRCDSMDAWAAHVRGAAALLEMRGPAQFQNQDNARVFIQVIFSLVITCLENRQSLPEGLVHLCQLFRSHVPSDDCLGRLFFASISLVQVSARIYNDHHPDMGDALRQIQALDTDYRGIAERAFSEPFWQTGAPCHQDIPPQPRHTFPTYLAAEFWYLLWSTRLHLHKGAASLIDRWLSRTLSSSLQERMEWQAAESLLIQEDMIARILTHAPQHLTLEEGTKYPPLRFLWDNFTSVVWQGSDSQSAPAQLPLLRLEGGYGLLRSLRAVGQGAVDPESRTRAAGLLDKIADQMGVRMAKDFAADVMELRSR